MNASSSDTLASRGRRSRVPGLGHTLRMATVLLAILGVCAAAATNADAQQWIAAWSVSQGAELTTPAMSGTSVRMIVRPTISGGSVRVRLENTLGQFPVEFSAAYIGQLQAGAALVPGSNTQLTFDGHAGLTLAPGDSAYSDPVAFPVQAFQRYAISLDVKSASDISAHVLGLVTNYMATGAHAADAAATNFAPVPVEGTATNPAFPFYWVAALDVAAPSTTGTVVAFGDSITDGECSTRTNNGDAGGSVLPDLYTRWTDLLATRLAGLPDGYVKAVADEGIAGNRIISGGAGPAALDRMGRDMLDREGVTHVVFFEGTNDIAHNQPAASVIAADQQIIERAHAAGLKIIGVTLIPRGGEAAWTSDMEQARLAVNDWIRHQANFDGLIDFDAVMQGSLNASNQAVTIAAGLGCFDGIHPNAAGYAAMAASIDLNLFKVAAPVAPVSLTWIPGSSSKVEQLLGDTDYQTGQPTLSQSNTRYQVAGADLGYSFEHKGRTIFLFGDTLYFKAGDVMGWSASSRPESLVLNFFTDPNATSPPGTLLVQPPGIDMGPFNVPDSGISLFGNAYVVVTTNHTVGGDTDQSFLTRFDEKAGTFTVLRNYTPVSARPGGTFIEMALKDATIVLDSSVPAGQRTVLMWGSGEYRKSDVYLARVAPLQFETGDGTVYLTGADPCGPTTWSGSETDANAVVTDGTIGNVSVTYAPEVGLWLMTYDSRAEAGIVFRYARQPWGPWSVPQVIFDPARDGGFGHFIHDPSIVPDDGLDGPTIGGNDIYKTRGADYAPYVIERFTKVSGRTLTIYYVMSTWNPYTVVLMHSDFTIAPSL